MRLMTIVGKISVKILIIGYLFAPLDSFAKGPRRRGGVGDGGGSGFACFNVGFRGIFTPNIVELALTTDGRIKPEYRAAMNLLWVTDYFEPVGKATSVGRFPPLIHPEAGETPEIYLARVIEKTLRPVVPIFAARLQSALHEVRRERWIPVSDIPTIRDHGQTPDLKNLLATYPNCALVQIVHRREDFEPGPHSKVLEIKFDPDLFDRLVSLSSKEEEGVLQQALLLLHEALYSIGSQMGHVNSAKVRALTRWILSHDFALRDGRQTLDVYFMLYSTEFFDLADNNVELNLMQRRLAFQDIVERIGQMREKELEESGHKCAEIRANNDVNCLTLTAGISLQIARPFSRMNYEMMIGPEPLLKIFSESELTKHSSALAFVYNAVLKNSPRLEALLWQNNDTGLVRSECESIEEQVKRNRFLSNLFSTPPSPPGGFANESRILEKAKVYCAQRGR